MSLNCVSVGASGWGSACGLDTVTTKAATFIPRAQKWHLSHAQWYLERQKSVVLHRERGLRYQSVPKERCCGAGAMPKNGMLEWVKPHGKSHGWETSSGPYATMSVLSGGFESGRREFARFSGAGVFTLNIVSGRPAGGSVGAGLLGQDRGCPLLQDRHTTSAARGDLGLCQWVPPEFEWEARATEEGNQAPSAR